MHAQGVATEWKTFQSNINNLYKNTNNQTFYGKFQRCRQSTQSIQLHKQGNLCSKKNK